MVAKKGRMAQRHYTPYVCGAVSTDGVMWCEHSSRQNAWRSASGKVYVQTHIHTHTHTICWCGSGEDYVFSLPFYLLWLTQIISPSHLLYRKQKKKNPPYSALSAGEDLYKNNIPLAVRTTLNRRKGLVFCVHHLLPFSTFLRSVEPYRYNRISTHSQHPTKQRKTQKQLNRGQN